MLSPHFIHILCLFLSHSSSRAFLSFVRFPKFPLIPIPHANLSFIHSSPTHFSPHSTDIFFLFHFSSSSSSSSLSPSVSLLLSDTFSLSDLAMPTENSSKKIPSPQNEFRPNSIVHLVASGATTIPPPVLDLSRSWRELAKKLALNTTALSTSLRDTLIEAKVSNRILWHFISHMRLAFEAGNSKTVGEIKTGEINGYSQQICAFQFSKFPSI